ncbi:MAG: hypothetical protein WAZ77_19775 [Candidatus Nitrosopolaris sp.]
MLYLLLVVAIAVTAVFDNHLEINMGNQRIEGRASLDSSDWNKCRWYCDNTNHVYAGLIGSGIFRLIANGGSSSAVVRKREIWYNLFPILLHLQDYVA